MDIFEFHPIFEFFLTFYSAYLISDDLKRILDEKLLNLSEKSDKKLKAKGTYLMEQIENSYDRIKEMYKELTPEFVKVRDDNFGTLRSEANMKFLGPDSTKNYINSLMYSKYIKPLFLFSAIYCFLILIFSALLKDGYTQFYRELFGSDINITCLLHSVIIINFLGIIFIGAVYGFGKSKIESRLIHFLFKNACENHVYVASSICIFIGFQSYSSVTVFHTLPHKKAVIDTIFIASSLVVAILPLILLFIRRAFMNEEYVENNLAYLTKTWEARIKANSELIKNFNTATKNVASAYEQLEVYKKAAIDSGQDDK